LKKFICVVFTLTCFALSTSLNTVQAHSGRTDSSGCHNCHTGSCAGEYHCHNGGSSGGYFPPAPIYLLPAPINPMNGDWNYQISQDNWCNYDVNLTWAKPLSGDRFSVAISKTAGVDPGPIVDTSALGYLFKNIAPGRWYINLKTGNAERWASNQTYWTLDLPKPIPGLKAYISQGGGQNYLNYDISCLDKVEGPDEFIKHLQSNNNTPRGEILLLTDTPTSFSVKGWDHGGKEYSEDLTINPVVQSATANTEGATPGGSSAENFWLALLGFAVGGYGLKTIYKLLWGKK